MFRKMKTQYKILRIDEIVCDLKNYPRVDRDWLVSYKYQEAMKSGANFPPICVAYINNKYVLVDGWHRLEAKRRNKEEMVECEVLKGLTPSEVYIEAVKRNIVHGKQFSPYEVTNIVMRLKKMKFTDIQISKLVGMQVDKMERFVGKRLTRDTDGKVVVLKKVIEHLSDNVEPLSSKTEQEKLAGMSQLRILDSLLTLIENKWLDLDNPHIVEKLERIYKRLSKMIGKLK